MVQKTVLTEFKYNTVYIYQVFCTDLPICATVVTPITAKQTRVITDYFNLLFYTHRRTYDVHIHQSDHKHNYNRKTFIA